jgi:hypothetical protein
VDDYGHPTSYMALQRGTPVLTADGEEFGRVRRVLQVQVKNIFDGVIVRTAQGDRFLDAPEVDRIYEGAVITSLTAAEAAALPEPGGSLAGKAERGVKRTWRRVTGKAR